MCSLKTNMNQYVTEQQGKERELLWGLWSADFDMQRSNSLT